MEEIMQRAIEAIDAIDRLRAAIENPANRAWASGLASYRLHDAVRAVCEASEPVPRRWPISATSLREQVGCRCDGTRRRTR